MGDGGHEKKNVHSPTTTIDFNTMSSPRAMPKGPAPINKEEIEIVKRKVTIPKGPPPNSKAFSAPKVPAKPVQKNYNAKRYDEDDDDDDDGDGNSSIPSDDEEMSHKFDYYESNPDRVVVREKLNAERSFKFKADDIPVMHRDSFDEKYDRDLETSKLDAIKGAIHEAETLFGKEAIFNFRPLLKATYRVLREFVMTPSENNILTRCYIERSLKATELFAPRYSLCADLEDGTGRELIVCRKILSSRTPHYVFSLKDEDLYKSRDKRSRLYLGKLRALPPHTVSSTSMAEYVLYDSGTVEPSEYQEGKEEVGDTETSKKYGADEGGDSLYRKELVSVVIHNTKRPVAPGVRALEVGIPNVKENTKRGLHLYSVVKPLKDTIQSKKQNDSDFNKVSVLHERVSRYDPLSSCLVDFKGRANVASVKNFQLVMSYPESNPWEEELEAHTSFVLQMAKTTAHCFNMDYKAPLSMLQAFAICVARMDAHMTWDK